MKTMTLKSFAASLCLGLLMLAAPAFSQTILSTTTLASAVTTTSTTQIQLTSNSGLTAAASAIFVADTASSGEAMFVNKVSTSGGYISVTRGYQTLGKARTHASGTLVFLLTSTQAGIAANTIAPSGSCTRSNEIFLPVISLGEYGASTVISDCIGGVWVNGAGINSAASWPQVLGYPYCGGSIYTGCGTNVAVAAATSMYCSEIDVPYSKYTTGLEVLNGATVATDKHLVVLYDASGLLLANSATAGATTAGASVFQKYAFTTPYYVVGPAKYYGCLQSNGTTDSVMMLTTGYGGDLLTTKAVTGQTFGTVPATFTPPTTFTTVVGPHWALY